MTINEVKRPWIKKVQTNSDPYYQTQGWKGLRERHRQGTTIINGKPLSNVFCVECFKQSGRYVEGATGDHIIARKDGGKDEVENIQTLCDHHNAVKRAKEQQNRIKHGK